MKKVMVLALAGLFLMSALPAFCEEAPSSNAPTYVTVYGAVETMEPQGTVTLMTVKLNEPMEDGSESVAVILNEWTRVVREYEDLTMADLSVGQPVMVVYEVKSDGNQEAVTVNLEQ